MADAIEKQIEELKSRLSKIYSGPEPEDQKLLARQESVLWDLMTKAGQVHGLKMTHSKWLSVELGAKSAAAQARRAVYLCGDAGDPLWAKLREGELALKRIAVLAVRAREAALTSKRPLGELVEERLREYLGDPSRSVRAKVGDHYVLRRPPRAKPDNERLGQATKGVAVQVVTAQAANGTSVKVGPGAAVNATKRFKATLAELVREFVRSRIEGLCDVSELRQLVEGAVTDVTVVCDEVIAKVQRRRSDPQPPMGSQRATRADLVRACEMLGARAPAKGKPLDMQELKKQYRRLSGRFHPDKTGGDERLTAQYREVQDAWQTIERWSEENRT